MDKTLILEKSSKGKEEISSHNSKMASCLRRTLILVDGVSDIEGLQNKMFGDAQVEVYLEQLMRSGYIKARIPEKNRIDGGVTPVHDDRINKLKWQLVDLVGEIVGPVYADRAAKKIIAAPDTIEGLRLTLKSCIKVIKLTIDKNKATVLEIKAGQLLSLVEKIHH